MEITIVNKAKQKNGRKDIILKDGMIFVHLDEREAITLIRSLSAQIDNRNANSQRLEQYNSKGTYFSIGVHDYSISADEANALKEKIKALEGIVMQYTGRKYITK